MKGKKNKEPKDRNPIHQAMQKRFGVAKNTKMRHRLDRRAKDARRKREEYDW